MAPLKKILVPTDFSQHSENAIDYGCDLASDAKAQVHLIHVIGESYASNGQTDKIRSRLERIANSVDEKQELAVNTVKKVIPGEPFHVITDYARDEDVDLIVMGTHGRSGLSHFALGSVAERVVRASICPVLVIGPRQEDRDGTERIEHKGETRLTDEPDSQAIDLIERARRLRATDVHLDPAEANEVLVRLRIDGKLEEFCRLNELVGDHLQNQLKTLSDLNIAEPFLPQEGRVRLPATISDLEVRITTARVAAGEAVALRLFDGKNIFLPLGSLGLSEDALESVNEMLRIGEGLVLVTGPTGSGKTTTVYSMLEMLGGIDINVVSVEDPVEFAVPFVRQLNVDVKHGITMTTGLRTILRMDPDVVFLGEIRDIEAAQISMRAASSGKYVLSSLHTRDVASTITTLRDMDIGDRSVAGNLTGIINQRLIRRLCSNCKKSVSLTDPQKQHFGHAQVAVPREVFVPGGCEMCRQTGFRGRVGVFEVALIRSKLSNAIAGGDSENHLKDLLRSSGVISLTTDALTKAAAGITSVNEALSVHWLS